MRHNRRTATALVLAASAVIATAGFASANEPSSGSTGADGRTARLQSGPSPWKVRDTRSTQAVPGTNGKLVFVQSPYLEWPNDMVVMPYGTTSTVVAHDSTSGEGDSDAAWSPGGTMIAFAHDMTAPVDDFIGDIYVMRADGSGLTRITTSSASDGAPDWYPDGSRIVFYSDRTGGGDIYSMKTDGTDVRRLTTSAAFDLAPTVSPDGKRIAFASDRGGANLDIYSMKVDGTDVVRLTTSAGRDSSPDWSPDGSKIVFVSDRTGDGDIFVMDANGSGQTNLTDDPTYWDYAPVWSPDGTKVLFTGYSDRDADLWEMAATGGEQTIVTPFLDDESGGDWQPIPAFPLVDARFSTFEDDIEWVFAEGITVGCSAERYCPNDPVTREQMAIFLDRALDLPATATDYFSDDTGRSGEAAINRLRTANITTGCAVGLYCPTELVSRGQMASFLARAFALPATATDFFTDDDGTTHEANINRVAQAGITSGCGPTTYCPTTDVSRGQMAAFLRRALEE